MGTNIRSIHDAFNGVGAIRTICNNFRDGMLASGAILHDSPQPDWNTLITAIPPSNSQVGSTWSDHRTTERYTFTDALNNEVPAGFFYQWMTGVSTASYPQMHPYFCEGYNPSGTWINARYLNELQSQSISNTAHSCYFSCAENRIGFSMWSGAANHTRGYAVFMERTKDANGNDTNEGILAATIGYSNLGVRRWGMYWDYASRQAYPLPIGSLTHPSMNLGVIPPPTGISGVYGNTTAVYPVYLFRGGQTLNPFMSIVCYFNNDLLKFSPVQIEHYGQIRTFLPIGEFGLGSWPNNQNITFAMLWE